jgi:hypothetical protein
MNKILLNHLRELTALEARQDDGPARERVRGRIKEAKAALRGMPDSIITLGELHTAYRVVFDNGTVGASDIADALTCSRTRANNALHQLEEADLVTSTDDTRKDKELTWQCWQTSDDITPQEANRIFDAKFPGLVTIDKSGPSSPPPKPTPTPTPKHKEPTKMATTIEYTKDESKVTGTKFEQVVKMIALMQKSDTPIAFQDLCDKVGAKYPQDVQAAMFALESVGIIDRYSYVEEGSTRSRIAYKWAQEAGETPRPTKSTSTTSRKRSSTSKQAPKTEEATPAAA